ncbi:predicted protein [Histoplasma capsulatum G186AR]|uniref:Uncharacterized protein n=1 Tax=Ajellomyces capsulatus (strain G186AR / H82 / ATCC MYA-2454 / RMSCC 2432) TaxID=447093 RepID=C0NXW3_AJECG|nr:uncharacterized protein HCBG_07757 [Histoplasma capsulatum G186AR]EEH03631.1 predicted protein [Histoplasma capsulatum G186AR]
MIPIRSTRSMTIISLVKGIPPQFSSPSPSPSLTLIPPNPSLRVCHGAKFFTFASLLLHSPEAVVMYDRPAKPPQISPLDKLPTHIPANEPICASIFSISIASPVGGIAPLLAAISLLSSPQSTGSALGAIPLPTTYPEPNLCDQILRAAESPKRRLPS